jgi:hypothetical protein
VPKREAGPLKTFDVSLNDHNGVVVRRDPLTRDHRLNVRSGSEADATEANVRFVPILLRNALGEHFGCIVEKTISQPS